jgi:hypothetical protein
MNEVQIRDYLAAHLDMIEPGLTLIEKEYYLPNAIGTRGFIDILARDRFGMSVIIEIKRSNKAAREAAHEFSKYVALLRAKTGIAKERLRCLLLSTEWRELIVPFSEFIRSTGYQAEGMEILLDEITGLPRQFKRIEPLQETAELTLCSRHMCFSYETRARRDTATQRLREALAGRHVEDYLLIEMEHDLSNPKIIYPFAHYLAISPLQQDARLAFETGLNDEELEDFLNETAEAKEAVENEGEDAHQYRWLFEELVWRYLLSDYFGTSDEVSAASPDTFAGLRRNRQITSIYRRGKWARSKDVNTDEDIIRYLSGFGGESTHTFFAFTNPRLRAAWDRVKSGVRYCLEGNDEWAEGVTAYLEEIEKSTPDADVFLRAFNPDSLAIGLYAFLAHDNPGSLHGLEIVVDEGQNSVRMLTGIIEWDGRSCPADPEAFIQKVSGDAFQFVFETSYGISSTTELIFQATHGLTFGLVEAKFDHDMTPVVLRVEVDEGQLERTAFDLEELNSFSQFIRENSSYLRKFKGVISQVVDGMLHH